MSYEAPDQTESPSRPLLIGTAGHIDHGKTTLVFRLTGANTDRLPEEKARGISIDLGFAHFDVGQFRFGVVDVPGHERFIRQMVAGAANIDIAILVVAGDDGVMPQTREHLDILQLLGVQHGVIAITRCDLIDSEMRELVAEELSDLVEGTFLESAPIMAVSGLTGEGIDELKQTLCQVAAKIPERSLLPVFRMPIDRVFTLAGRGTIVTGSVLSGQVAAGDEVELLPEQRVLRVRGVQHHGQSVDHAGAHRRAAINLAAISVAEVHRGNELATPGTFTPTTRVLAEIDCLGNSKRPLRHRQVLTLHAGTTAVTVRLRLTDPILLPGQKSYADLRLKDPTVLAWGQRFILRSSSSDTVGGGRVVDALPGRRRVRDMQRRCKGAGDEVPTARIASLLEQQPSISGGEAVQRLGVSAETATTLLQAMTQEKNVNVVHDSATGHWISGLWLKRLQRSVLRVLSEEIQRNSPRRLMPRSLITSQCRNFDGAIHVPLAINALLKSGELIQRGDQIGLADQQVVLTKRQREVIDLLLPMIAAQERTPPMHRELYAATNRLSPADVEQLLRLCREDGTLIAVSPDLSYTPGGLESLQTSLRELFQSKAEVTLAEIRDALQMTRKHVVPLAEYWDAQKVTVRHGDFRKPGPNL
ncbi:MAG TPA: selenocysteine-specific translation elongation factor [Planctomycetaceae bacterium]|nr:selenocysteine-specific translation elongation factor [Planctomycetaceae bacterium]HQZ66397.1 selenocysteine-specific translation elongation factor [Planctomycetaceae bacterium]